MALETQVQSKDGTTIAAPQVQVEKGQQLPRHTQRLHYAAENSAAAAIRSVDGNPNGLTVEQVSASRKEHGDNHVTEHRRKSLPRRLTEAFVNPFTAILTVLAIVSAITDMIFPAFAVFGSEPEDFDPTTVVIIVIMVILSGTLRFVQETRSGNAAEKLLAMISTTCTVLRDGEEQEIDMDYVVVGDLIKLSAGDMIPADCRILESKDLFVVQSALTGESDSAEKDSRMQTDVESLTECTNLAFMGTSVVSGSGLALALVTGDRTLFGSITQATAGEAVETSFTKGVNAVSWVLIRFMLVMVPLVFVINGLTKGDWLEAFLFGISIAVGLTP